MYSLRYYLHKRIIDGIFNDAMNEINKSELTELDGIYNYYIFEFNSIARHIKYCDGGDKRDELFILIKKYRKQLKNMCLERR